VGGVGYWCTFRFLRFDALGDLHSNVTLLIHTQVREDAISLRFSRARETFV
jgi:Holliday junction resolvasome RuvABC DNA-binding subunit